MEYELFSSVLRMLIGRIIFDTHHCTFYRLIQKQLFSPKINCVILGTRNVKLVLISTLDRGLDSFHLEMISVSPRTDPASRFFKLATVVADGVIVTMKSELEKGKIFSTTEKKEGNVLLFKHFTNFKLDNVTICLTLDE